MADPVTKEQVEAAEADFQAKVAAHNTAANEYNTVVPDFVAKRQALRTAYAAEVQADAVLTDLISRYEPSQVPPVPADE